MIFPEIYWARPMGVATGIISGKYIVGNIYIDEFFFGGGVR